MAEKIPVLTISLAAAAALSAEHFVTFAGGVPTQGLNVAGVAASAAASGEQCPVQMLGIAIVVSGGTFSAGAPVSTDATGAAIAVPGSAPNAIVGRALDASTASGQRIRVALIPN